jgi:hypothetical protein
LADGRWKRVVGMELKSEDPGGFFKGLFEHFTVRCRRLSVERNFKNSKILKTVIFKQINKVSH